MAFDDLPKVAASHVQSTRSSDRLRVAFGPELYVLREERPEYGTDFQAELVLTDLNAWRARAVTLHSQHSDLHPPYGPTDSKADAVTASPVPIGFPPCSRYMNWLITGCSGDG